ncbi:hypothetical protein [uncultured Aquimarina sp.]|uniref:hypothetical protein n=1 Tax=uncultured Aquimarina sp. TaxID=575652 RepID=UPI002630FB44|nr:hypothetical protein [uncultured Aquimarina sp.]
MKYLIVGALALGLILTSCNKEEIETIEESVITVDIEKAAGSYRVWYDNGNQPGQDGVDYGCKGSGGNCLDTVVVTASMASPEIAGDLVDTVGSGNTGAVIDIFKHYGRELSEVIPANLIEGVIGGELQVSNKGTFEKNEIVYLNFNDRRGNTKSVIPLRK